MQDVSFDIESLSKGYAENTFSVADVVRESLRRAREGDPYIWIALDTEERLLASAAKLDRSSRRSLPLFGIPFAVKDNIDVEGLATTAGCPDFRYFAQKDASVVARLRQAGAIPVGKTNLDQFATGLVGTRSPYGVPENPFDKRYIPGGSSSGSAVSVALGQVSFSLGTDTAGSGRVPACFNNIVGLKPTRGCLSCHGVVPACRSLDCVSIFSLNVGDSQKVLHAASGSDRHDPYSRKAPARISGLSASPSFGVPDPAQLEFFGDPTYTEAYLAAIHTLESIGFQRRVIDFRPFRDAGKLLYEGPWIAERYWAIRDLIENSPNSLYESTRTIIAAGREPSAVDAFAAFYELQELRAAADEAIDGLDFLALPTAGTHYAIEAVEADPIALNSNLGYYTNFLNLFDMAAVAVPTSFTAAGLPFGVTLAGKAFSDELLIAAADQLHKACRLAAGTGAAPRYSAFSPASNDSTATIAVCGAHLSEFPLNHQLTDLGATLARTINTAPHYRLFALPKTEPPKPGLVRDEAKGAAIEVEIWNLPLTEWGRFIEPIAPPLGIGSIELEDGSWTKGFLCESWALDGAEEATHLGGWRAYLDSKNV